MGSFTLERMSLARRRLGMAIIGVVALQLVASAFAAECDQPAPDLATLARRVIDVLKREYSRPSHLTYIEHRRDIDISRLGKVSVGPLRTFEVYPTRPGDSWKRLVAIDGKPLDPAELARRDAEHHRDVQKQAERERSETPKQRAARLAKEAEEVREREAILDDAYAVFDLGFVCRETIDGTSVLVLSLTPRPDAKTTTREGGMMKHFTGRMWVSETDHHIARLRLHAREDVSIGWGVVARVEAGSGFDYVRKRVGDAWAPSELTIEGSGRTLLFRKFQVKTVTKYSGHQRVPPPAD
jgi:hypothetical protein